MNKIVQHQTHIVSVSSKLALALSHIHAGSVLHDLSFRTEASLLPGSATVGLGARGGRLGSLVQVDRPGRTDSS